MAERFLIMNDQWKIRSQIFCLGFATTIEGDFNRPFFAFAAFENPSRFQISKCRNRLIFLWPYDLKRGDALDAYRMLENDALRIVLGKFATRFLLHREHWRFDEKRWALRIITRDQDFDSRSLGQPIGRDGPR